MIETRGILIKESYILDKSKNIDVFMDASFAGDWNTSWLEKPTPVMLMTAYVIMHATYPIIWCSKLMTEITLSTIESAYVALS